MDLSDNEWGRFALDPVLGIGLVGASRKENLGTDPVKMPPHVPPADVPHRSFVARVQSIISAGLTGGD